MSGRRAHPLDRWVATLGTGGRALETPCITQSSIGNPTAHRIACGTVSGLVGRRQGEAWSDLARRATRQPERRRGVRPAPTAESRDFRAPDGLETMSSPRGRSRSVAPPAPIRGSLSAPPPLAPQRQGLLPHFSEHGRQAFQNATAAPDETGRVPRPPVRISVPPLLKSILERTDERA